MLYLCLIIILGQELQDYSMHSFVTNTSVGEDRTKEPLWCEWGIHQRGGGGRGGRSGEQGGADGGRKSRRRGEAWRGGGGRGSREVGLSTFGHWRTKFLTLLGPQVLTLSNSVPHSRRQQAICKEGSSQGRRDTGWNKGHMSGSESARVESVSVGVPLIQPPADLAVWGLTLLNL